LNSRSPNLGSARWAALLSLFVIGISLWGLVSAARHPETLPGFSTGTALATAARSPVDDSRLLAVEVVHLGPGEAPATALLRSGVEPAAVTAALAELGRLVRVRAMQSRDDLRLFSRRDGSLARLEYQRYPERCYVVEATETGWEGNCTTLPVERVTRYLCGEVSGNLYDSVRRSGGSAGLVVELSDLFAWSFDFFTDTRNGDRFEVLVEERRVDGEPVGGGRILAGRYRPVAAEHALEAFYFAAPGADGGYYDGEGRSVRRAFLKSPLNYRRISSHFSHSRLHPILKKPRPHLGIDYAAPTGTPVVALGSGKVTHAGWIRGFGHTVKIKHTGNHLTQYAHLSRYAKGLRAGKRVSQGQVIGFVGSTGLSTGPHLDFRVQKNGRWINPLRLKGGRSEPLADAHRDTYLEAVEEMVGMMDGLAVRASGAPEIVPAGMAAAAAGPALDTPSGS